MNALSPTSAHDLAGHTAMAAGISKELLSWETIIELVDQAEQRVAVTKRWEAAKLPQPAL